jgi:hypothetical protein
MDKKQITKILAFMSLSDGYLNMHKGCVNASFHLGMKNESREFAKLAIKCLEHLEIGYRYAEGDKYFRLNSKAHPFLTTLWERIYQDGRKVPSPHDFKLLDWEAMAILYMADGNIQKAGKKWYPMLNLCRWSYAELCWIKTKVKEHLNLDVNVYKCGKYYRLGVPVKDCEMFFDNISGYMLPGFDYKLPYGKPH